MEAAVLQIDVETVPREKEVCDQAALDFPTLVSTLNQFVDAVGAFAGS
jgi:peroxiredoxin